MKLMPSSSIITNHTGRSYVYGLKDQAPAMSVDSAYAGNPARYINHAPSKRANTEVHSTSTNHAVSAVLESLTVCTVHVVNGEPRVGIFASRYFVDMNSTE